MLFLLFQRKKQFLNNFYDWVDPIYKLRDVGVNSWDIWDLAIFDSKTRYSGQEVMARTFHHQRTSRISLSIRKQIKIKFYGIFLRSWLVETSRFLLGLLKKFPISFSRTFHVPGLLKLPGLCWDLWKFIHFQEPSGILGLVNLFS